MLDSKIQTRYNQYNKRKAGFEEYFVRFVRLPVTDNMPGKVVERALHLEWEEGICCTMEERTGTG